MAQSITGANSQQGITRQEETHEESGFNENDGANEGSAAVAD
jgi:hypothetical protein